MRSLDKIKGCMIGGAVGDALGYAVEFMRLPSILRQYGAQGITRYYLTNGVAQISDDTQMALFTAVGLLFGETRGRTRRTLTGPIDCFWNAYLDWYDTQTKEFPPQRDHRQVAWLANFREFYSLRAPGNTCLSALGSGKDGSIRFPINHSMGCGGVMRVAPIGVYLAGKEHWTVNEAAMAGAEAAAVTHGHELAWLPSAALTHMVYTLALDETGDIAGAVRSALEALPKLYPDAVYMTDFLTLMNLAVRLAASELDERTAIRQLGEGWVGDEALAISVYCALKHPDSFEQAIIASVNHDGDSDSTGAITGNIVGTALGYHAIPDCYLEHLELRDIIEEISEDLYNDCPVSEQAGEYDPAWKSKYIEVNYNPELRRRLRGQN